MTDAANGVEALARVLPSAVLLRKLDLNSSMGLNGDPVESLAAALPHCKLEDLDLSYCGDLRDAYDLRRVLAAALHKGTRGLRRLHVELDDAVMAERPDISIEQMRAYERAHCALQTAAGSIWWTEYQQHLFGHHGLY